MANVVASTKASDSRLVVGTGFLGSEAARRWVLDGVKVFGTTRNRNRFDELSGLGIEPVVWDVLSPDAAGLPAVDAVLYCVGFDRQQSASMRQVYIDGLRSTLEGMEGIRRLVYVSSTGVHGDFQGEWVDESSPAEPADESGRICLEAENIARQTAVERGWECVVLRLAGLYGPGRMIGVDNLRNNKEIAADPRAHVNLIHLADAAAVAQSASLRETPCQTYLVSDGNPVRRVDFYSFAAKLLGTPPPRFASSTAKRSRGDRRIRNDLMRSELLPQLQYPDYRAGLKAILEHPHSI